MIEREARKPEKEGSASTRTAVWAGAGIVAILAFAFFVAVFVAPVLHTRAVVREYWHHAYGQYPAGCLPVLGKYERPAIERFGGPDHAVRRLSLYVRLPEWAAPHRLCAVFLLGHCGEPAVPALKEILEKEEDEHARSWMTWALRIARGKEKR